MLTPISDLIAAVREAGRVEIESDGTLVIEAFATTTRREGKALRKRAREAIAFLTGEPADGIERPPQLEYRPFPVHCFPAALRRFVNVVSKSIGCDESYVALPLSSALSSSIGNSRELQLKRGWTAPAILWTVCVGESGSQKSPPFKAVMKPVRKLQRHLMREHEHAEQRFELDKLEYEQKLKAWKKKPEGDAVQQPSRPPAPRVVVSDTTIEALASVLKGNPRGVLLASDELNAWFGSFDRYNNGNDASHWLTLYNGETLIVDRKTGERLIIVPSANVSVAGGIQPGILRRTLTGHMRESGMAARLLMAYPPARQKQWTEADVPPEQLATLESLIDGLRSLKPQFDENGDPEPSPVRLSPDAKDAFVAYFNEHAVAQASLTGDLASAWSKLEECAARIALVIHLASWVLGETDNELVLSRESMNAGVELARWFGHEAKRIYAVLDESKDEQRIRELVDLIRRRGGRITARDLCHASRKYPKIDDAQAALDELRRQDLGGWEKKPTTSIGGRPTMVFRINTASTSCTVDRTPGKPGETEVVSTVQRLGGVNG